MACTGADNVFPMAIPGQLRRRAAHREGALRRSGARRTTGFVRGQFDQPRAHSGAVRLLSLGAAAADADRRRSSSSCRPAISATCSRAGCSRAWACRDCGSALRRTATTSCIVSSPPANMSPGRSSPAWRRRWTFRSPRTSNATSTFWKTATPPACAHAMAESRPAGAIPPHTRRLGAVRSTRLDDAGIAAVIRDVHARYGYVCDPHTACGFADAGAGVPRVILATASPAKFPETVVAATGTSRTIRPWKPCGIGRSCAMKWRPRRPRCARSSRRTREVRRDLCAGWARAPSVRPTVPGNHSCCKSTTPRCATAPRVRASPSRSPTSCGSRRSWMTSESTTSRAGGRARIPGTWPTFRRREN